MRITSGDYKNRRLFVPEGKFVRPTSDRMRQSLFNILRHPKWDLDFSLDDKYVADLFCGSGSLGLEALSNGAKHCVFVDQDVKAVTDNTGFLPEDDFEILKMNLSSQRTLGSLVEKIPAFAGMTHGFFDLVFMDPPYNKGLVEPTLQYVLDKGMLSDGAILIIETEKSAKIESDLELLDERYQSESKLSFLRYNTTIK